MNLYYFVTVLNVPPQNANVDKEELSVVGSVNAKTMREINVEINTKTVNMSDRNFYICLYLQCLLCQLGCLASST